jgi:glycerate kinase
MSGVNILLAPDSFGGTLSAVEAADAMARGWERGAPHDTVAVLPLADGGPGFVQILHAALGGDLVPVTVSGPFGAPTPALVLLVTTRSGRVAYLESAQAVGLHLVPPDERDPTRTSTTGVGELVRAAVGLGAGRVVVGLGGTSTNDGGAGMLSALGVRGDALARGGGALIDLARQDLEGLTDLRRELAGVDLVVATDVDVPLLGLHGASAGFAAQKGASPDQAQELERALGHFAQLVASVVEADGVRPDLMASSAGPGSEAATAGARALTQLAGAGAGGGLGFALAALGARVLPGAHVVADAIRLPTHVAEAEIVVTGEGTLDWQSLHGKVVSAVAHEGLRHGIPVVVVAGQVLIGRREWGAAGIAGAYAVSESPDQLAEALADPAGTLETRVERVARTWSR